MKSRTRKNSPRPARPAARAVPRTSPRPLAWLFVAAFGLLILYHLLTGFTPIVATGQADGYANLRTCPSTRCPVITALAEGTPLLLAPHTGEPWLQALSPSGQGYIYSAYVEVQP